MISQIPVEKNGGRDGSWQTLHPLSPHDNHTLNLTSFPPISGGRIKLCQKQQICQS
jgi:hypothetical protein